MKNKTTFANAALLLAAFIWGTAFVAQSVGMDYVGPFTFLFVRSFIGSAVLLIFIAIRHWLDMRNEQPIADKAASVQPLLTGGILCGLVLCAASGLQQMGMQYTTVGNAGFITSMYMLIVPVLSVFLGKKVPGRIWFCILLAAVGLYFLSFSGKITISKGDLLIAGCAFFFAVQIMIVDYYAPKVDGVKLSCCQFIITGILSMILAFVLEEPEVDNIWKAMGSIAYAGVFSSGVAFTLQIVAQKYAQPTIATLFMSMESVFSLLGGMVILQQFPSGREIIGCLLVFTAVILSQIKFA